jgi:glycosyltransferase involved in cell wall biosynthesis
MKILFIIPYAPTLIRTRPYNLLKALARRGHQLTLATFWENPPEQDFLLSLKDETGISLLAFHLGKIQSLLGMGRAILQNAPLQSQYSWHPRMAQALKDAITKNHYDIIHVEHLRGSPYGLLLEEEFQKLDNPIPIIYDSVDSISLLYGKALQSTRNKIWKQIIRFELPRTQKWEAHLVHVFDRILATSLLDCESLAELASSPRYNLDRQAIFSGDDVKTKICVLPNGVDLNYFSPTNEQRQKDQIIFSGKMSYHANSSAAIYLVEDVMPHVWAKRPEAKLVLAGKSPPRHMREMAERNPNIIVTGGVPDMRPYLRQATVAVAPITYGAGIQNKVLEAMACATPVVATPLAVSSLTAVPDRDVLVGETAETLAQNLRLMLENSARRDEIGANGRKYVENYHDWDKIVLKAEYYYQQGRTT